MNAPTPDDVIRIARLFDFVREAGQNRGLWVEAIQHAAGGGEGDSWCLEIVWDWLCIAYKGNPPFPRMQSCQALYDLAKKRGWVRTKPKPGMLFLYVDENGHAHHVGVVTLIGPLTGIAGNTSADGLSSNGDRVAEHAISASVFIDYAGTK